MATRLWYADLCRFTALQEQMPSKASIAARLPIRRGLSECEAAVYLSLSPSFFRRLVEQSIMPRPRVVGGRRIWDIEELDLAFRSLPHEQGGSENAEGGDSWSDFE
jgi:hypothetical protein